uniref:Uncharacterized protein n=1 Tax=Telonemida sp. TaxID=2652706 RepID=A0A5P8DJX8_9EUKA|nr:hypothetical protein [Telonemida sp.]
MLIVLFVFFEQYKFIISVISFRIFHFLKNTEYGKARIAAFKNDREIIENHWSDDKDLIYLTYFCRGLYVLGTLSVAYSMTEISKVSLYSLERAPDDIGFFLFFGYCLIMAGIVLTCLAEFHIIFYRNTPVKNK